MSRTIRALLSATILLALTAVSALTLTVSAPQAPPNDNLALLKMWSETTPRTIFPNRKIGALSDGHEASFLALEGNPVADLNNVRKIKWRFKQGVLLEL